MGGSSNRSETCQFYRPQPCSPGPEWAAVLALQLRGEPAAVFFLSPLSPRNLPAYLDALERFQPVIIDGYPSAIHIVADYILHGKSGDLRQWGTRAILVSAETVFPHQRAGIEAAFRAKLYNQYASSEGAPFVSECAHGRLHVHTDSGLVEILDSSGAPAPPGQVGQMVVTSFTTHVIPMLRFAMGDAAIPSDAGARCECGLRFPVLEAIVGRVDDILCTPDRGFVGRMDTVFKGVPSTILEAQIVQTSAETIVLRIVVDPTRYEAERRPGPRGDAEEVGRPNRPPRGASGESAALRERKIAGSGKSMQRSAAERPAEPGAERRNRATRAGFSR